MNHKILQAVVEIAGNVSPTLSKSVESTCKKLDKVNLKAAAVAAAAAAGAVAIGKGAIEAGKYLADLGGKFDGVADSIRVGTGATGEALDSLMDDFDAVYSSVPTTMEDASKAIADYNKRLGLTGEELQGVSSQAIQVADMLGEDLGGVIESSSKAFQQWDIDAKNMGGAMDFVFKASQSTGVGFTELMTTVQSFGPQLQEMGYSFEEATALIGQMEKAGVNTEEVLGAMKKSTAALAKEGIGASEGLDMYANAIMNAKDMTQATAIASEVFGTRAASTMAAALRDGSISADQLTKSLMENGETISGCATDTYDFAEQLQLFKQKAEVSLQPLAATVFDALNDIMPIVGDLFEQLAPIISELLPPIMSLVTTITGKLIPPIMKIVSSVIPVVIDLVEMLIPIIDFVIAVVGEVFEAIEPIISACMVIIGKILPPITKLLSKILPMLTPIISAALGLLDVLTPILDAAIALLDVLAPIIDLAIMLLDPILNLVTMAFGPLMKIITALINVALVPLGTYIKLVSGMFTGYLSAAVEGIQPIINAVTGAFKGLISFIKNVFTGNWKGAWDSVVQIFSNIWDGIVALFKMPINTIIGGINGFLGSLNKIKIPDWVPLVGGKGFSIPLIPTLATGGFTDGVSIAGEAGMEAVISFDPAYHDQNVGYWQQAGQLLGVLDAAGSGSNETTPVAQAGKLMGIDDFSLGQLTETTIIYYDFSGFSYAPHVGAGSDADKEDIVAALKEQASEFFDWLEEWLRQKEVGDYDRVSIY